MEYYAERRLKRFFVYSSWINWLSHRWLWQRYYCVEWHLERIVFIYVYSYAVFVVRIISNDRVDLRTGWNNDSITFWQSLFDYSSDKNYLVWFNIYSAAASTLLKMDSADDDQMCGTPSELIEPKQNIVEKQTTEHDK